MSGATPVEERVAGVGGVRPADALRMPCSCPVQAGTSALWVRSGTHWSGGLGLDPGGGGGRPSSMSTNVTVQRSTQSKKNVAKSVSTLRQYQFMTVHWHRDISFNVHS